MEDSPMHNHNMAGGVGKEVKGKTHTYYQVISNVCLKSFLLLIEILSGFN